MIAHRGLWVTSKELPLVKLELREKISKLSYRDVRRARIPIYEALLRELFEDGCTEFGGYFEQLTYNEHQLFEARIIKKKLIQNQSLLIAIVENFRIAGRSYKIQDDLYRCLTTTFQTARMIECHFPEYIWFAKECYLIIFKLLVKWGSKKNFEELEARSRYFFGKFCLKKLNAYQDSIEQLSKALGLSRGKSWTTTRLSYNYLHSDISIRLCQAYLAEAKRVFRKDPNLAAEFCFQAVLAISESNPKNKELYCEASLRKNQYLIRDKQYERVLRTIQKVTPFIFGSGNSMMKCEMFLQEGICYFWLNNIPMALRKLKNSIRLGEVYGLGNFKALALVEIGKIYAKQQETFQLAQESLKEAKQTFEDLKDTKNAKKVNYYAAILKAQEILPNYLKLIKSSDHNFCDMMTLRKWKESTKPFWNTENDPVSEENHDENKIGYKCILKDMLLSTAEVRSSSKLTKVLYSDVQENAAATVGVGFVISDKVK